MHPSVRAAWFDFNTPLEGWVSHMYVDVLGLITAGMGNLADPVSLALSMPWEIDGRPATHAEIRADWSYLKAADSAGAYRKRHYKYAAPLTRCRMTEAGVRSLVDGKLSSNYAHLKAKHFPEIDTYPADAQMAILSLAWAVGPDWPVKFPKTKAAVRARDWAFAATEGKINSKGNPGVIPRNHANERCFLNAQVVDGKGDHTKLHWPASAALPVCPSCKRPL